MNSKEIIRRLKREGWYVVNIVGSHHHFKHDIKKGKVTVPHPRKDIKAGTLRSIYKQAGWK